MTSLLITDFYDIPKIKNNNWDKWTETLTISQKKLVNKIRKSYKDLHKSTGIIPIEVILPISPNGIYWIDYPWDYARELYPNMFFESIPYIIIVFKIDENLHIKLIGETHAILAQHINIKHKYKEQFFKYMKKFNSTPYGNIIWNGKEIDEIEFS